MALGISFVPGESPDQTQPQTPGAPPIQQALQLLSLRLPRFGGVNAIAPDQLLNSRGGPVPGSPEWHELMRRLMGANQPTAPVTPSGPPPLDRTTPSITPGDNRPNGGYGAPSVPQSTPPPRYPVIGQYPGAIPTFRREPY